MGDGGAFLIGWVWAPTGLLYKHLCEIDLI